MPRKQSLIEGLPHRHTIRLLTTLVAWGALTVVTGAAPALASVTYETEWGSHGSGDGQFGGPIDLAATPSGTVFVSDTIDNQLPHIQAFSSTGDFLRGWGASGDGDGQFLAPGGIAVGPSGAVYVGDFSANRIQRFGPDGSFLGQWGTSGSGAGQFAAPWGIAADDRGRVYVVDYGNNRIQKFSRDGDYLDQWGSFGSRDGQFLSPSFIATDSDGHVYVADSGNSRIQKFRSNGRYLDQWDTPGPGAGPRDYPLGVATDPEGDVYVVGANGIQKYDARGRLLTRWGGHGRGKGEFRNPQGIATDSSSNVYVGDSGNDRIQKFHDAGPPYPDPGTARLAVRSPAKVKVSGGKTFRLTVRVRNTGSNAARKVKVCIRKPGRSGRAIKKVGCKRLGSIGVGKKEIARFRVSVRCVSARSARLVARAGASNARRDQSRTRVRITGCRRRTMAPSTDPRKGRR